MESNPLTFKKKTFVSYNVSLIANKSFTMSYYGSLYPLNGFPVLRKFRRMMIPQCTLHILLGQHAKLYPVFS